MNWSAGKRTAGILAALLLGASVVIYVMYFHHVEPVPRDPAPFSLDCAEIASIDGQYDQRYLPYMDSGQPGDFGVIYREFRITSRDGIDAICALFSGLLATREPADMQDLVGLTVHYKNGDDENVIVGWFNQTTSSGPAYDIDSYALVETVVKWNELE